MVFQSKPFSEEITGPYSVCLCTRCRYRWNARNPDHRPGGCPQCGSANWDKPPRKANARTPEDPPNPRWGKYRRPRQLCPLCIRPLTGGLAAIEARKIKEGWRQARKIGGVPMMTEATPRNRRNLGPKPRKTNPDGSMIITPAERQLSEYLIKKYREVDAAGAMPGLEVPVRLTPPPGMEEAPSALTPPPQVQESDFRMDKATGYMMHPPQSSETPEVQASKRQQWPGDGGAANVPETGAGTGYTRVSPAVEVQVLNPPTSAAGELSRELEAELSPPTPTPEYNPQSEPQPPSPDEGEEPHD